MICDEAKGCGRYVREFSWSMSDFKPGDCNMDTVCVLLAEKEQGPLGAFLLPVKPCPPTVDMFKV